MEASTGDRKRKKTTKEGGAPGGGGRDWWGGGKTKLENRKPNRTFSIIGKNKGLVIAKKIRTIGAKGRARQETGGEKPWDK